MGARHGLSSRWTLRDPTDRRRAFAVGLFALIAVSGVQCVQDLIVAPPSSTYHFSLTPDSALVYVGDTISPPFSGQLTADGREVGFTIGFTVIEGASVVRVDSLGRLIVTGRGVARIRARPMSVALPVDTIADTVAVWAVVPRIGLSTARTEDTLTSLQDTVALQATALSRSGVAIPSVPIAWRQISGAGTVTLLDSATGRVRAEANGSAEFEATVDTAHARRTVRVVQRPTTLVNTVDTVRLRAIGQTWAIGAALRDARAHAVTLPITPAWQSKNTGIATVSGGQIRAVGEGTTQVIASYSAPGINLADTTTVIVQQARLALLSGNAQSGTVGAALAAPLAVQIVDGVGTVIRDSGVTVIFRVTTGGGHFGVVTDTLRTADTVRTDLQGQARTTPILGKLVGPNDFSASGAGLAGAAVVFTATGAPAPARTLTADSGMAQTDTVGKTLGHAFVVIARDTFGNAVSGLQVRFVVTAGGGKFGGWDSLVTTTDALGRARTVLTLGTVAGTQTVEARANVPAGAPVVFTATAVPAQARRLAFTVAPATLESGRSFAPALQVTVRDTFGNRASAATPQVSLGIVTGSGTAGARLGGTTAVGAVAGVAAFPADVTVDSVGTGYRLVATATGLQPDTTAAFDVTPGALDNLAFLTPPTIGVAGRVFDPPVQVVLRDANGNRVTTARLDVQLDVYTVGVGGSQSLFGTATATAANGVVTFGDVGLGAAGTGYRLRARVLPALQPAVISGHFDVRGAPASIQLVSGNNQNGAAGVALADSLAVRVLDASGKGIPRDTVVFDVAAGGGALAGATTLRVATDTAGRAAARLTLGPGDGTNTVTARSVSLTGQTVTFTAAGISGTLHLAFAVQPSTIDVGGTFSPAVRVEVRNALEAVVTGVPVTVTLALAGGNGSAALTGTAVVPTVAGVATFIGVGVGRAGVGFTLTASSGNLTSATSASFTVVSVPASIMKDAGDNQNGLVGTPLGQPFSVRVLDGASDPVVGDSVVFKVASGAANFGGLDSAIAVTDAYGRALATLALGTSPGAVTVTGRSIRLAGQSVTFSASATVAGRQLEFVVQPSFFMAGHTISPAPQVRVRDTYGNTEAGATTIITLAITAGTGTSGAHLSGATSVAAVNGVATFPNLGIDLVGTGYTLTATATGLDPSTSTAFFVTFGAAKQLRFSVVPTQSPAGAPFAVEVQVLDSLGNLYALNPGPAVTIAISAGTGTAGAHLRGTLTQNGTGSGSAIFTGLSIDSTGTGYTLTATATGLTTATSSVIAVTPAPAVRLAFSVQPSNVTAGVAMNPAVVVLVQDSLGNTVTGSVAAVTLAFGANPAGATLSGTTSVAAANGVATFANLRIARNSLGYTLVASTSGLAGATSATFGVFAAPASRLVFTVQPSNVLPGAALTPAVQVAVQDSVGNVPGVTNAVTLAITSGTGTAGATLAGTTTVSAVNGVATFANLTIATLGNNYTLTATAGGLSSGVSGTFSVLSAGASRLVFTVAPSSATAGAAFGAAVQVAVQDGSGTTVPTATNAITLAITGGSGTANAHLRGTVTVGAVGGVATFPGLSIDSAGAGYTLAATSSGLASGTSGPFTVLPAPAVKLEWRVQPSSRTAGNAFSPAVQVALRDSLGNLATTTATSVTMAITAGTGAAGAVLSGTTPMTSVNGVATFADLSIAKAGTGYTLTASASGLPSIVSGTFSITIGAVASLFISGGTGNFGLNSAGATWTITVEARDASNNIVPGPPITWTSLNPNIATVNAAGVVAAVSSGQVAIMARVGGATAYALGHVLTPGLDPVNLWAQVPTGTTENLRAIWGTSATNLFAVGGNVFRYTGSSWTPQVSGSALGYRAVWGASATDVWAVGLSGSILHFDGSSWTSQTSGVSVQLYGVWGRNPVDVYAVGDGGTVLHYDGASWTQQATGTTQALRGVWGVGGDAWVVGAAGTILHQAPGAVTWTTQASGTSQPLYGVSGINENIVTIVGEAGTILHFDGSTWSAMAAGGSETLTGIAAGADASERYAVSWGDPVAGVNGVILRQNSSGWFDTQAPFSGLTGAFATGSDVYVTALAGGLLRGYRGATVTVTPATPTLTAVAVTRQLTAVARGGGTDVPGVTFRWTSSNGSVATVDPVTGVITAVANGTATITATAAGGAAGSATVTVAQVAKTVTVTPAGASITGGSQTFTAAAKDSLGNVIPGATVAWSSLSPFAATIDSSTGVATAVGAGQVTVAATAGGVTGYALLTVATPGLAPVNLWVQTLTTDTILFGVWGTSASNVWAVGAGGRILHYDGTSWTPMASPTSQRLRSVWGSSKRDVYAAGDGGLLHFDGSSWSAVAGSSPCGSGRIWGSSPADVWACGLHFNGTNWAAQGAPVAYTYWGFSSSNVYAAGDDGTISHFDGATWTPMTSGTSDGLYGLWGTSSANLYAAGDDHHYSGSIVLHFNGTAWAPVVVSSEIPSLQAVGGSSGTDVYVSGGSSLLHYDGATWSKPQAPPTNLYGVWAAPGSDVFAVGGPEATPPNSHSFILRGVRGATVAVTPAADTLASLGATQQLTAVATAPTGVAVPGVTFVWYSSDTTKVRVDSVTGVVTAVAHGTATITAMASGGAVGSTTVTVRQVAKTVLVFGGTSFQGIGATETYTVTVYDSLNRQIVNPSVTWTSLNPNVATIDASGHLTTAGAGQVTISATSGTATGYALVNVWVPGATPVNLWAPMASGVTVYLNGVWGTSASNVFAVGESGTILRYDGTAWNRTSSGVNGNMFAVWGPSSSDVYAVGVGGTILHFNGNNWSAMQSGTARDFLSVWGMSARDVYAVGTGGTILHYNGTSWSPMTSGTVNDLWGVWGASSAQVFAVGDGGTILRYDGSAWAPMASGLSQQIRGVWGTYGSDVYAAAYDELRLQHYDGTNWSVAANLFQPVWGVWGTSGSDVYAVGGCRGCNIIRYDGATASPVLGSGVRTLTGVWGTSAGDVYAVGEQGTILRGVRGATVAVTPVTPRLTVVAATLQLTATGRDTAGNVVGGVAYSWASSNPGVVSVDQSGLVTSVTRGVATIVATAPGGAAGSATVVADLPVAPQPPTGLGQFTSNGTTALAVGQPTGETSVVLKAAATDSNATDTLTLQVEVQPVSTSFNNLPTQGSPSFLVGGTGVVTISGLVRSTSYHWHARTCDQTARCSTWVAFGANAESEADFSVAASGSDNTTPVVTGVTVDRMAVDVRAGADSVVFTFPATDDLSGVSLAWMVFKSPSGNQTAACTARLVSGTTWSGTYRCAMAWQLFAEAGTWVWFYADIRDAVGNQRQYDDRAALAAAGWPTEITVQSTSDATAPVVTGVTANKTAVDVRAGADSVVFTFPATDDMSGIALAWMVFKSPSGNQTANCTAQLVSGTALSGTYRCAMAWQSFAEAGTWVWFYADIRDAVGNQRQYDDRAALAAAGWPTEITVVSTPDGATPVVTGVTADKTAVDVRAGADSVVFTFTATDDMSGIALAWMVFKSPSGNQTAACTAQLVSGTALSGTYRCVMAWQLFAEAGTWVWFYADIRDAAGNQLQYDDRTALAAAGWPTEITVTSTSGAPPIIPVGSAPQVAPANLLPLRRP